MMGNKACYWGWVLPFALLVASGCAPSLPPYTPPQPAVDPVAVLLDPTTPPTAAVGIFYTLEKDRAGCWPAVLRLRDLAQIAEHADTRDRARWALWCLLGPDASQDLLRRSPGPTTVEEVAVWARQRAVARVQWSRYATLARGLNSRDPAEQRYAELAIAEMILTSRDHLDDASILQRRVASNLLSRYSEVVNTVVARVRQRPYTGFDGPLDRATHWRDILVWAEALSVGRAGLLPALRTWDLLPGPTLWLERRLDALATSGDRMLVHDWVLAVTTDPRSPDAWFGLRDLLTDATPPVRRAVAELAGAVPEALEVDKLLINRLDSGFALDPDVLRLLRLPPATVRAAAAARLNSDRPAVRFAALQTLAAIGGDTAPPDRALAAKLWPLVRGPSPAERHLAALALSTPDAARAADLGDLIDQLRSPAPADRLRAALGLERTGPPGDRLRAALVRATAAGDFATREGLTLALDRAWQEDRDPAAVLAAADTEPDVSRRAYLRAARRAIAK